MSSSGNPLRFLVFPSLGEVQEHVRVDLFGRVLSQRLGRPVVVELAPTYEMVEQELAEGRVDLAWATPEQCSVFGSKAWAVLRAVRSGRSSYSSAFVCRSDAPLSLETLKGTRVAWVAPRSTGGHLLPVRHLLSRGIIPSEVFAEQRFVGTYRRALAAVLKGEADLASIYVPHSDVHSARAILAIYATYLGIDDRLLTPFAFTEPTPADGIILSRRLSQSEAATLTSVLTGMTTDGNGADLVLGPFKVEGFVQDATSGSPMREPPRQSARRAEYLALELDEEGRCHRLWAPTGKAFGVDVREAEGRLLEEVLSREASAPLVALARAARYSQTGGRGEYRLEVEGQTRSFAVEATPCVPRPGQADSPLTALLVRDVTEFRALEEPLFRMASIPLLHPEPLLELSLDGGLLYANPATHMAFPDLMVRGAKHPLVAAALEWARRGAATSESPLVNVTGRHWELTLSLLHDIEGLRVFARDVTLRKQMESRLVQSDRQAALGHLAASVGHEMNNPLAFMISNLSFAKEELGVLQDALRTRQDGLAEGLEDVLEALGETVEGAERLRTIVEDLRTLSRKPQEYRAKVDLHPVLENALKLVRGELRHRGRLEKDFRPVPPVDADEARLVQVFLHLLLNAVQAMSEADAARNVLRVATYTGAGGEVVVEVQDTGRGMPAEVLAHLFEPFVTTRKSSRGLGLSVSHAIVTSLGGTLRVESHEGVGTLFTATFPPAVEQARQVSSPAQYSV
jgi:signal transduction histidine kinase/ABC-type phosphate/phosphonate transport system substrate-binding protein